MYVDAIYDRKEDLIQVVERSPEGKRNYRNFKVKHQAFVESEEKSGDSGDVSIFNTPLKAYHAPDKDTLQEWLKGAHYSNKRIYESDLDPIHRVLSEEYLGAPEPELQVGYFDIEVDFCKERGFAKPNDPFNPVQSISLYLEWLDELITLIVPPTNGTSLTWDEAVEICSEFENTTAFKSEWEMLDTFLDLIAPTDVLTGWNSEAYDIPYLVNRVKRIMGGGHDRRFCLWNIPPRQRKIMGRQKGFGNDEETYTLFGRIHLDYQELYKKYTYSERHSYALNAIGEYEGVGEKVVYESTLADLYRNDFRKFIEYGRQDVMLLKAIDGNHRLIALTNSLAHDVTVTLPKTMLTTVTCDQAIINEIHAHGQKVFNNPNRVKSVGFGEDGEYYYDMLTAKRAVGAYVANPKRGIHKVIGSIDLTSLYPTIIRMCNMSPETLLGQFRPDYTNAYVREQMADDKSRTGNKDTEENWDWDDFLADDGDEDNEEGDEKEKSFESIWDGIFGLPEYELIMERNTNKELPLVFEFEHASDALSLNKANGGNMRITGTGDEFYRMIFEEGNIGGVPVSISANGTVFRTDIEGHIPKILAKWFSEREEMKAKRKGYEPGTPEYEFWDRRQHVKKIQLNSLYGALLEGNFRFFDIRIGQSVTMTGRRISRHLHAQTNEVITGDYDQDGPCVVYGDTDSVYFSAVPGYPELTDWDRDDVIELYDGIASSVNETFAPFMMENFAVDEAHANLMKGNREIVGSTGLFIKKKRYAIMVYDDEGKRKDTGNKPGEMKVLGLEIKRSDTPKIMQDFLSETLFEVLDGASETDTYNRIKEFRNNFRLLDPWQKGTPKRVNNLTKYTKAYEQTGKCSVGHALAAINWNRLRAENGDMASMPIEDGQKTIVCKLDKLNEYGMNSIAYPIDQDNLPDWFKRLPFDEEEMEKTTIDKKVGNLFGVLEWDLKDRPEELDEFFV